MQPLPETLLLTPVNHLKPPEKRRTKIATKDWHRSCKKRKPSWWCLSTHLPKTCASQIGSFRPKILGWKILNDNLSCHHPEVDDSKVPKLQEVVPYLEMHQVAVDPLPPGEPQAFHLRLWGVNPCPIQHGTNWTTLENQHLEPKVMEVDGSADFPVQSIWWLLDSNCSNVLGFFQWWIGTNIDS